MNRSIKERAFVSIVLCMFGTSLFAAWTMNSPTVDEEFNPNANIGGDGDAATGTADDYYQAKVTVNDTVENSLTDQVDYQEHWGTTVTAPVGDWTTGKTDTEFEVHHEGSLKVKHRIKID